MLFTFLFNTVVVVVAVFGFVVAVPTNDSIQINSLPIRSANASNS